MSFINRFFIFIKERYPPFEVTLFLAMESFAGYTIGKASNVDKKLYYSHMMSIFIVLWLFFLQLRIFDDIKDYETDRVVHPNRPLSRGLISHQELKYSLVIIIFLQLTLIFFLSLLINWSIIFFFSSAIFFSILMRYEFFVKTWIKKHIFVYLVTHQLVIPLIMILPYLTGAASFEITQLMIIYMTRVIVGNFVIELTRKTVGIEQEHEGFETYSSPSVLGYKGAAVLITIISFIEMIPVIVFEYYPNIYWNTLFFGSYGIFLLSMLNYVLNPTEKASKLNLSTYGGHVILALGLLTMDVTNYFG